ncbi:hypothetical protein XENTR_v10019563 [Xenopus tropicalis]|nr:hypothetical protein XENTR_v10019563 [Xenopus tropicalis]
MWTKKDFSTYNISFLDGNKTLQINFPNKTHNGSYLCFMDNGANIRWSNHLLYVYYKVENVVVSTSSRNVVEGSTSSLNLTCNASAPWEGTMTWLWEGNPVNTVNTSYSLLDDNATLQINQPSRSNDGNYTCVIANPASRGRGEFTLRVSTQLSAGAIAGIVIGSVLGALLLIGLIVLIVCCIRKKKGQKEKTPSGPKHKDVLSTVSGPEKYNAQNRPNGGRATWESTQASGGLGHETNSTPVAPQKGKHGTLV